MQSGFLLAISLVLNHEAIRYGNAVVAGFGVAARVTQIPEFLAMGVVMGAIPLLAYAHGAGDESRLAEALKKCVTWTAVLVVPLVVLALIFRVQLMEMFGGGSLGQSGVTILVAMLVAAVFNALGGLFTAYFQATGRGAQAGVLSALAGVLFLPIALLAPLAVGLTGLVWAMPIAEITTAIVGGNLLLITLAKARREPSLVSVQGAENPADPRINDHATTEPQAAATESVPVAETPSL